MKYGYIINNYGSIASSRGGFNVGDAIQQYALLYLYDLMGIKQNERLGIELCDINKYNGEYAVLPLCGVAVGIQYAKLPLPHKIIPVFISVHIAKSDLNSEEIYYLRKYQPIGCRDEFTLDLMRKNGIDAYLTGCITAILPREHHLSGEKVYLVDTPETLNEFLPETIKHTAVRLSHLLPIDSEMNREIANRYFNESIRIINEYRDNAALVISSRMHALVPCMAMGIPVIAAFENISYRYSWLDKYIKLYSPSEFAGIDWKPKPVEYESVKRQLIEVFRKQIMEASEKYGLLSEISDYYENRERAEYGNLYRDKIRKLHAYKEDGFDYMIWGCGLIGSIVHQIMKEEFPRSNLIGAIDSFYIGKWHDVAVVKPSQLKKDDPFIFLASFSGRDDGYKRMEELSRIEDRDFIYLATKNG